MRLLNNCLPIILSIAAWLAATPANAQAPAPPEFSSPELTSDNALSFRLYAPEAKVVRLLCDDFVARPGRIDMARADSGLWETTLAAVPGGAYRYVFEVDGLKLLDRKNPATSEANSTVYSLVTVPGNPANEWKRVPHGAVAKLSYYSSILGKPRRLHVYTPPGYETSTDSYPVLYLLHGASDSDESWVSVGRAHHILDNLIADGKARRMVIVMPNGHPGEFRSGGRRNWDDFSKEMALFADEFRCEIRPLVESRYRLKSGREHRALAGLSMGGAQALDIGFDDLADYGYLGVFSSGVFGLVAREHGPPLSNAWEERHAAQLGNADLKSGLHLLWFGCGKRDFLWETNTATIALLRKHGFDVTSHETDGAHQWMEWRDYLAEFAPKLFPEADK